MGKERLRLPVAVFLILCRTENSKKEILLQLRQNTGFMDGFYDLAATGHLDEGESLVHAMCREAREELNITILPRDLKLTQVVHDGKSGETLQYLRFFFEAAAYKGTPQINEKEKCADLKWFDINKLPQNIIPYIKTAIKNYLKGEFFTENNHGV